MNHKCAIHSLSAFKQRTTEFVERLKATGDPIVLTINGKAAVVVQDSESYQKLLDIAEHSRVLDGIREGLEDMNAGRTISLDDFRKHVEQKLTIRRTP